MKKNVIFHNDVGDALTQQNKIDQHNLPFTLNASIGCHFGCQYCFIQGYPFSRHAVFGKEVKVKLWIADELDKELYKYQNLPQHLKRVQVNVMTEGYLPSAMIKVKKELNRDIMKEVLDVFRKHWNNGNQWMVHLITKSHMVRKHLDIIAGMRDQVQLEITITTLDEERKKILEGLAPTVKRRLDVVRQFSDVGVFVRIMCMPLIGAREDANIIKSVCFNYGAKAFKHKGVNYWNKDALLNGQTIKDGIRKDEVFEDLLVMGGEPVIEDGKPKTMVVPMPVIIRAGKSKKWKGYQSEHLANKVMIMENFGYTELNDINWGYVI